MQYVLTAVRSDPHDEVRPVAEWEGLTDDEAKAAAALKVEAMESSGEWPEGFDAKLECVDGGWAYWLIDDWEKEE